MTKVSVVVHEQGTATIEIIYRGEVISYCEVKHISNPAHFAREMETATMIVENFSKPA